MSVEASSWVWRLQDLPGNGKLVLLAIADHADPVGMNAWPSHETLARKTGYSVRQVKRIIDALVGAELLTVEIGGGGGGRADRRTNRYTLNMAAAMPINRGEWSAGGASVELRAEVIEAFSQTCALCHRSGSDVDPDGFPWEVDRIKPGREGGKYAHGNVRLSCRECNKRGDILSCRPSIDGGTPETERGDTAVAYEPSLNHPGSSLRSEPRTDPDDFDDFWRLYPNKVGKPTAKTKWRHLSTRERDDAFAGLSAWSRYWEARNEPQFIPHPSTWLNQRRWEDSPPPLPAGRAKVGPEALGLTPDAAEAVRRQPRLTREQAEALDATREHKEIEP